MFEAESLSKVLMSDGRKSNRSGSSVDVFQWDLHFKIIIMAHFLENEFIKVIL